MSDYRSWHTAGAAPLPPVSGPAWPAPPAPQPRPDYVAQPQAQPQWGQPWATPATYWGPLPPKKRMNKALIALLIVAGIALFGGCATLLVKGGLGLNDARRDVDAYASALVQHRESDAYARLCLADQRAVTLEQFSDLHRDDFVGYTIESLNLRNFNGVSSGEVRLRFTRADGGTAVHIFLPLRRENGAWKPCDSA